MGKTLVYLSLFGILGFGVYYFFFKNSDGLFQEKEANFSFKDTSAIGKIFLVENDGTSILLERNDFDVWTINKKYPAMKLQVVNILTCLKLQTAFSPVGDKEFDRVIKLLAGLATKVEVYDRQGNKMRSFYVAGQGPNYHGSYMIQENAKQPYLVDIPGFDGYLTPRYTTQLNDWRSRTLIDLKSSEISFLEIQYPNDSINSFKINNIPKVPELISSFQNKGAKVNMRRVLSYLDFFKLVNAEGYLNGSEGMDSIIASSKLRCKMLVNSKKNELVELDLYWITSEEGTEEEKLPSGVPASAERLYCVNKTTSDTLLVQIGPGRTFQRLIQNGSVFFQ
jgi:hypothetical protein